MKKKFLSFILSVTMFASTFSLCSNVSFAKTNYTSYYNSVEHKAKELNKNITNPQYEELTKKLIKSLKKVESSVEANDLKASGARFSAETIYDLNSIGARIDLFNEIAKTITVASTELCDKVMAAHTEIGFEISKALIIAADPFRSVDDIKEEIIRLQKSLEKARTMPEIKDTDFATIYVKSNLKKAIWNTRFERDRKILGKVPFKVYHKLNKNITKAVGIQLNPRSTVKNVKDAIANLKIALDEALSQVK